MGSWSAYVESRGVLTAREVRLLGLLPPGASMPGQDPGPPPRNGPPPSTPKAGSPILTEVRLQSTRRAGGAALPQARSRDNSFMQSQARSGVEFYIAFYIQVDAKAPARLAYHCQDVDMERGAVQDLKSCAYEEVVPGGFRGVHFRAFPMKYTLRRGQVSDQNVITAE